MAKLRIPLTPEARAMINRRARECAKEARDRYRREMLEHYRAGQLTLEQAADWEPVAETSVKELKDLCSTVAGLAAFQEYAMEAIHRIEDRLGKPLYGRPRGG